MVYLALNMAHAAFEDLVESPKLPKTKRPKPHFDVRKYASWVIGVMHLYGTIK